MLTHKEFSTAEELEDYVNESGIKATEILSVTHGDVYTEFGRVYVYTLWLWVLK